MEKMSVKQMVEDARTRVKGLSKEEMQRELEAGEALIVDIRDWNWPRKKYLLKLEINSFLTRSPVQKQADCYTATLNVIGPGYKSTLSTRRW